MTKLLVSVFSALLLSRFAFAGDDAAAQQLLATQVRQANIFQADASPLQIDVDFTAQFQVPVQGHLTTQWQAPDRWWRKITIADFQEIEIRNGERMYTSRNASFTPYRVKQLIDMLYFAHTQGSLSIKKVKPRVDNGVNLTCFQTHENKKTHESGHELCIDPKSHDLLSDGWKDGSDEVGSYHYADYFEFHGHRYPRELQLFENGSRVIDARVQELAAVPLNDAMLVPPQGALERRFCKGMTHPVAVKAPDPMYPKSASQNRLMGDTTVAMTVLADGSVGDVQVVGSAGHTLDNATLKTLKSWKFKPAMCGSEPVVSDIHVQVFFRLN